MTAINVIYSMTIQDGDQEVASFPIYQQVDDTTTVAGVVSAVQSKAALVQPVLDGAIVKVRAVLEVPLPSGMTDPATVLEGVEIERTGLLTFPLQTLGGRSYSYDLPAFAISKFIGNKIDLTDSAVAALCTALTASAFDNTWSGGGLGAVKKGQKTFRKHRRQTKRV